MEEFIRDNLINISVIIFVFICVFGWVSAYADAYMRYKDEQRKSRRTKNLSGDGVSSPRKDGESRDTTDDADTNGIYF